MATMEEIPHHHEFTIPLLFGAFWRSRDKWVVLCCAALVTIASSAAAVPLNDVSPLAQHPRDYYFPNDLAGNTLGNSSATSFSNWTGRGIHVALLDTGLCPHVAAHSLNTVHCTSVVPNVPCEAAGCEHGTRSLTVLGGHLRLPGGSEPSRSTRRYFHDTWMSTRHYTGMAPDVEVRMIRVFDVHGQTSSEYLATALDLLLSWQEEADSHKKLLRSRGSWPVDVLSLSYGSEDYSDMGIISRIQRLVDELGVIVVAAAGNEELRFGSVHSPADVPGVLAVGALELTTSAGHQATGPTRQNVSTIGKRVAPSSARGPTTWELPYGAGRVKPDLVALGSSVWAVSRVGNTTWGSQQSKQPRLRVSRASGTSIAAPIVAGAAALCLEAVRSSAARSPALQDRRAAAVLVRTALLTSARPIRQPATTSFRRRQEAWRRVGRDGHSVNHTVLHDTGTPLLAGVPLLSTYERYLSLLYYSRMSQGEGEVWPLKALAFLFSQSSLLADVEGENSNRENRKNHLRCRPHAVPSQLHIGHLPAAKEEEGNELDEAEGVWDTSASSSATEDVSCWPLCGLQSVFPGSAPVLVNCSLALCPPFIQDQVMSPNRTAVTTHTSFPSRQTVKIAALQLVGYRDRHSSSNISLELSVHAKAMPMADDEQDDSSTVSTATVATIFMDGVAVLRVVAVLRSSTAPTSPYVPTSFTLSLAYSVPPDAKHHPLFEQYSALRIDGVVHVFQTNDPTVQHVPSSVSPSAPLTEDRDGQGNLAEDDTESMELRLPWSISIVRPPERARRILVDTSLDWLNPTAAESKVFIAGDDPHESSPGSDFSSLHQRDGVSSSGYAEMGGDHPHTHLALLCLYLRYELNYTIESFAFLHAAIEEHERASSEELTLSGWGTQTLLGEVGILLLLDAERPLQAAMRRRLTAAVQSEGLDVIIISDWFSPSVSSSLSVERDSGSVGGRHRLRAWWTEEEQDESNHLSGRGIARHGLPGSCHIPSINQWLREVATHPSSPDPTTTAPPLQLSTWAVVDGLFGAPASPQSQPSQRPIYRSIGVLRGAGLLHWGAGVRSGKIQGSNTTTAAVDGGWAVLCNVHALLARQHRLLLKRPDPTSPLRVVDEWMDYPEDDDDNGAASQVSHGIVGFLQPPVPPTPPTSHETSSSPRPGRIALFTDSDCLSAAAAAPAMMRTLRQLDTLLSSERDREIDWATWETMLQRESTQPSLCLEVIKELLYVVRSGDAVQRWAALGGLRCESRPWSFAAPCSSLQQDNEELSAGAVVGPLSERGGSWLDVDVAASAPSRVAVGTLVRRMWAASVSSAEGATTSGEGKTNEMEDLAHLTAVYHANWSLHCERAACRSSSPGSTDGPGGRQGTAWLSSTSALSRVASSNLSLTELLMWYGLPPIVVLICFALSRVTTWPRKGVPKEKSD